MTKPLLSFLILLFTSAKALAAFSNYNTILIGERAAGMGGAYTALTDDQAGCAYYNPAAIARMEGASLSASANIYAKYDTLYGDHGEFDSAALRVNQGSFVPIPASSGSIYSFRNFAFGISILLPDMELYNGAIITSDENSVILNLRDQSLWVGGTMALNLSESESLGLTMYYTSRSYNRSTVDKFSVLGIETIVNEDKTFSNNSIIYILGYYKQLNPNWSLGFSHRFSSLEISGRGSFSQLSVSSSGGSIAPVEISSLASESRVPTRTALGIAYTREKDWSISMDLTYFGSETYYDLNLAAARELVVHKPTWNIQFGGEYYYKPWLALRTGLYTNFASTPEITDQRIAQKGKQLDHIDMWGFSANAAIHTSDYSRITLGGYYTGGRGQSTASIAGKVRKIAKTLQMFSFLVSTSFSF